MIKYISLYILGISIVGYRSMGIDKKRAIQGKYRVPEKTLLSIAFLGGSLGSIMGMYHFRHKTKHWYFRYGLPLILILQLVGASFILKAI